MSNPELKLCPFCDAQLTETFDRVHGGSYWAHPADTSGVFPQEDGCIGNLRLVNQRDFDRWNRRSMEVLRQSVGRKEEP